ncbi:MAG: hypothetical protein N838_17725 [Thiohalocapsa sp. PB-PSB1]|nr:MAG: hypothetical protein N838_17725 [Thiohalocapsa sp. PB-PSB1]
MSSNQYNVKPGDWDLSGANFIDNGVNFCCFSRQATAAELLLFEQDDSPEPFLSVQLDPKIHRTFFSGMC